MGSRMGRAQGQGSGPGEIDLARKQSGRKRRPTEPCIACRGLPGNAIAPQHKLHCTSCTSTRQAARPSSQK